MWPDTPNAVRLQPYQGRRVYRFVVARRLLDGSLERLEQTVLPPVAIVAHTAADAANTVLRETILRHGPAEVECYGPKGGVTYRYGQWESAIGLHLSSQRPATQTGLDLGPEPPPEPRCLRMARAHGQLAAAWRLHERKGRWHATKAASYAQQYLSGSQS